jgi:hypothetical protein
MRHQSEPERRRTAFPVDPKEQTSSGRSGMSEKCRYRRAA